MQRGVIFAVGLLDPFTGGMVHQGLRVEVLDRNDIRVLRNLSGNFVGVRSPLQKSDEQGELLRLRVVPERAPFEEQVITIALKSSGPAPSEYVHLMPSVLYPFPPTFYSVHGQLQHGMQSKAPAVAGAIVSSIWETGQQDRAEEKHVQSLNPIRTVTGKAGQFFAGLLASRSFQESIREATLLRVTLRFDGGTLKDGPKFLYQNELPLKTLTSEGLFVKRVIDSKSWYAREAISVTKLNRI
ncbi:MAG TPA: hypothetical protein DCL48_11210 [Alphaproteobacteria bacterium]|nr:hypothetical protein [Alphaproteobacteria bacterium]